ncbi:LPD23 domain-containing protein [Aquimarina longa]|uniref:LPD23 domain-containing protein n=1 Tax=Aquimarina longa TaxID=1080221 RepID=UPI0007836986|nr:LPD23 domain-containing protein [Aquimarina longa]
MEKENPINDGGMTPEEFSQKIKKQYPQYSNMGDIELAHKIIEKYPVYADKVNFDTPKKKELSFLDSFEKKQSQKFDLRPKTIDREKLFNEHSVNKEINTSIEQKKQNWREERSQLIDGVKQNIEQKTSTISLDDIVQKKDIISKKDTKDIDRLNRMIKGKWHTVNKGVDLDKEYANSARKERFKGILENDLQPEFTLTHKAKQILKDHPEITPDFAEKQVKDERLKEAIGLLPNNRSKRLYKNNVKIAELKEKWNKSPSDKELEKQYYDAKIRLTKEMKGNSWWKSEDNNTTMFDESGFAQDQDFQEMINSVGKDNFLKDLKSRYQKFDEASKDKENFSALWNDKFEKLKAIESKWETAKNEYVESIPWNHFSQEKEKKERKKANDFWKAQYTDAKMDFGAINEILLTNVDPSSVKRHWYQSLRTGIDQGFSYDLNSYSTDQLAEVYKSVAKDESFSITKAQKLNAKLDLGDEALRSVGSSLPAMVEIIGTTYLTQGLGTAPVLTRLAALSRLRYGRMGQKAFNFIKGATLDGIAFQIAPNNNSSFAMGVGENVGQNIFQGLEGRLGKVRNKYLRFITRIGVGSVSETTAEYIGDFTNELSKNGFDIEKAIEKVIGTNTNQSLRKLVLTAITTTAFSTGSNITSAVFSKVRKEAETLPDSEGKNELIELLDEANKVNNEKLINDTEDIINLTEIVNIEQQKIEETNHNNLEKKTSSTESELDNEIDSRNSTDDIFDSNELAERNNEIDSGNSTDDIFDSNELAERNNEIDSRNSTDDIFDSNELAERNNEIDSRNILFEVEKNESKTPGIPERNLPSEITENKEFERNKKTVDNEISVENETINEPSKTPAKNKNQSKPLISKNQNYQIRRDENGMVEVFNRDGSVSGVTGTTKRKYIKEYIENTNFNTGKRAIDTTVGIEQDITALVADHSQNPHEVAETIIHNNFDTVLDDKTVVIANNVSNVSQKSFHEAVGYTNKQEGVSQSYFSPNGKSLDQVQMNIISDLGHDYNANNADSIVSIKDITDFMLNHKGANHYLNEKSEIKNTLLGKFEELTGLTATKKNIKAVAGITNDIEKEVTTSSIDWQEIEKGFNSNEEIPFKIEKTARNTNVNRLKVNELFERLKKTFPKNKIVMDTNAMTRALNDLSTNQKLTANDINFLKTSKGEVFGFVHPKTGEVFLDPKLMNYETPIHEFGHIWASHIKNNNKALFNKGLQLIENTIYHQKVKSNPAYANLSEKAQLEEALVTAIGDRGAMLWGTEKNMFQRFLEKVKRFLSTTFFKEYKGNIDQIDLDTFLNKSLADILSGRDLKIDPKQLSNDGKIKYMILGRKGAKKMGKEKLKFLELAKQMSANGANVKDIWMVTGWELGGDGKWKIELYDGDAKIKNLNNGNLSDILDFPKLFEAYKKLSTVEIIFTSNLDGYGMVIPEENRIFLSTEQSDSEMMLTLMHEVQHLIQNEEGFAGGASTDNARNALLQKIKKLQSTYKDLQKGTIAAKLRVLVKGENLNPSEIISLKRRLESLKSKINKQDFEIYLSVVGEVEARNIETRHKLSVEERKNSPLSVTEDIAREDQVILETTKAASNTDNSNQNELFKNIHLEKQTRILFNKTINSLQSLKTKTAKASAIRKDLRDALKDFIDSDTIKNLKQRDLGKILTTIENAKTKASLEKALHTFEEIAITAERRKIKDKYKQRLKELKSVEFETFKKELSQEIKVLGQDFFGNKITSNNIKNLRKSELERIYKKLESAKTETQIKNLAKELEDMFYELESRRVMVNINKILKRKLTKRESGRKKANLTNEQSTKVINGVKSLLKDYTVNRKDINRSEKSTYDLQFLSDLLMTQRELISKVSIANDSEINQLASLNIAIGIINSKTITSPKEKLQALIESEQELSNVYDEGRSNHLAWVLKKKQQRNDFIKRAVEANNINDKSITPTKKDVIKQRNALVTSFMKLTFAWTSGSKMGDLDSVLQIIDKKGNRNTNEGFSTNLLEELKSSATNKEFNLREYTKILKKKQREIFGSKIKGRGSNFSMENILGKKHHFTVKRPQLSNDTGQLDYETLEDVNITLTESQLLNLWMHHKNQELHQGFVSAGYDTRFMENVNNILNKKTKAYGEFLFDFYDNYYNHINTTYKEMYGHSLGKPKFYAGKLSRYGYDEETVNLMDGFSTARTTAGGSTKERLNNKLPIQAQDVNITLQHYLFESEHFVQYASIHAKYDAMLKDKRFQNSVMANNKYVGDAILEQLKYYRDLEMVRGGKERESLRILDVLMGNVVKSTLAIKPKIALTQTLSIPNAIKFLPRGKNAVKGYNPITYFKDAKHIFKNSKYIKNRLDTNTLNKAITGLNSISNEEVFGTKVGNSVKQFIRAYDTIQNTLMLNVKAGDLVGVMGSFPLYSSWKAEYLSRGMDESTAEKKAMLKFETAVDRTQQGQTKFSKSKLQNHPVGKVFSMFATSPMQNYRNAISSYVEVSRYFRKNQEMKGSLARHLISITNFSLLQPLLYTWIAGRLKGGLGWLLNDDDEPSEAEKSMLSTLILRNTSSIPMVGSALTLIVDELVEKKQSFGGLLDNPVLQEADNIKKYYNRAKRANTTKSKEDNYRMMRRSFYKLITGFPVETVKKYKDLIDNGEEYNDKYDVMEMLWLKMGHSKYAIDVDRKDNLKNKKQSVNY